MTAATATPPPVLVAVTRRVEPRAAAALAADLRDFIAFAAPFPGYEGMQILRRSAGGLEEFTVFARFADAVSRAHFKHSPEYADWMRRLDRHGSAPAVLQEFHGLEAWFTVPDTPETKPPPTWKMAAVTYLGVNVVTSALLPLAPRVLGGVPFPWSNFLFNLAVVGLLTWAVMPLLTRLLRPWLAGGA